MCGECCSVDKGLFTFTEIKITAIDRVRNTQINRLTCRKYLHIIFTVRNLR